jgi:hypothetical protein
MAEKMGMESGEAMVESFEKQLSVDWLDVGLFDSAGQAAREALAKAKEDISAA